jgi:hypothetical protein
MAYHRPPSEDEIDSHYAMFTVILEDGMKMKRPPIEIMMSVDGALKDLYRKNRRMASEVAAKMNRNYCDIYKPFRFRT